MAWGDFLGGGNTTNVDSQLDGSVKILRVYSTSTAFAALRADGTTISWGDNNRGGDSSSVSDQMGSIASISSLASSSAPQLSSPNEISFEGAKDVSTFSPITGTLIGVDPDSDQLIYGISGGSISLGKSTSSGQYGTL